MEHINNWPVEELKKADLGNNRLKTRYMSLLDSLSKTPSNSIPMACKNWKETIVAYRFFNNGKVRDNNILSSQYRIYFGKNQKRRYCIDSRGYNRDQF
jgi:hypothetical protein